VPGIYFASEGLTDAVVGSVVCRHIGLTIYQHLGGRGKAELDRKLSNYNRAARSIKWVVLRDLDHDAECAPSLRRQLLSQDSRYMHLRIAVRAIEAWLLGDRQEFAGFFAVGVSRVPSVPEQLDDPKQTVIELVARSRKRDIRSDMVPERGSGRREGPGYAGRLIEYAETYWRPHIAAATCPSLHKTIRRLRQCVAVK